MAGLIARLLGGKAQQGPAEPMEGVGGYAMPAGPANQTGYPGSTSQTRTFRGATPRDVKLDSATNTGTNNALSASADARSSAYRGDSGPNGPGLGGTPASRSPRVTPRVMTPRTAIQDELQRNSPAEFYGGPALKTGPGNNTAGAHPLTGAKAAGGHSMLDTQTPWRNAQPNIGENVPGSSNVRNTIAERYKARPGQVHTYKSAYRADQTPPLAHGQNADGNVKAGLGTSEVSVPSRFVFDDGGNQTWAVGREMPYGGRGDGARGADLNGQRYYATGQADQFWNAGQGNYGIARQQGSGNKSPVSFTEPAPWTAQFYTTTDSVGTTDNPNSSPGQQPNAVYVSPSTGRASNGTGRRG